MVGANGCTSPLSAAFSAVKYLLNGGYSSFVQQNTMASFLHEAQHNSGHTIACFREQWSNDCADFFFGRSRARSVFWTWLFSSARGPHSGRRSSSKCARDPALRFSSLQSNAVLMMSDTGPYPESPFLLSLLPFPYHPVSREQLICLFLIAF